MSFRSSSLNLGDSPLKIKASMLSMLGYNGELQKLIVEDQSVGGELPKFTIELRKLNFVPLNQTIEPPYAS
jgi:hypothetical protein